MTGGGGGVAKVEEPGLVGGVMTTTGRTGLELGVGGVGGIPEGGVEKPEGGVASSLRGSAKG